jgi:predicted amidohydrolase YtcJ
VKILALTGLELRLLRPPARSQLLYLLSYPGSIVAPVVFHKIHNTDLQLLLHFQQEGFGEDVWTLSDTKQFTDKGLSERYLQMAQAKRTVKSDNGGFLLYE